MLSPFFALAVRSPGREQALRSLVAGHLAVITGGAWWLLHAPPTTGTVPFSGLLLLTGIVEGALVLGWRLSQLPRSRALEFLLASPVRPYQTLLAEALVGLARLALVTFSGLPVLALLSALGRLDPLDLAPLILMPFTWGALAGMALTVWAYESPGVRRWGERVGLVLVVFYLIVGVLAGEHLRTWLAWLSKDVEYLFLLGWTEFHRWQPFAVLAFWLENEPEDAWRCVVGVEIATLLAALLLTIRAAGRLQGHFQDRHYAPILECENVRRPRVGDQPLSWWAVKRVTEYSGRVNLWLAGGFGVLYALYTVAGSSWPAWLGSSAFQVFDSAGGVPLWATALTVLAAVPAAFQYGLWDSSTHERCRRLELLLLTDLDGRDYWQAAAAAAWRRGRGYFAVALLLWAAALGAGRVTAGQALAAAATGVLLWCLYFALGFRAFGRGRQSNGLGLLLTLGLPLVAWAAGKAGWPLLAALVPPGAVYLAGSANLAGAWLAGSLLAAGLAIVIGRRALAQCLPQLRQWYEEHHGRKIMD